MRLARAFALVTLLTLATAPLTVAANNGACATGWTRDTVEGATALIWPHLLAPEVFDKDPAGLAAAIGGDDRDGNGFVCIKTMWGDALNPNSKYYRLGMELIGEPTWVFMVHDDRANATN